VAATGQGEEIIRRMLCREVYALIEAGAAAQHACERGVALMPRGAAIGLIAVDRRGWGVASSRPMPWAVSTRARRAEPAVPRAAFVGPIVVA
jgi:L-asparaginase/beta-aspartyl-peptidase (threonine type)